MHGLDEHGSDERTVEETGGVGNDQHGRLIAVAPYGEPVVDETAWIAPGAMLVGAVAVGPQSSVWYNAVIRGDSDEVRIGSRSNVQDGVAIHTQRGDATVIEDDVSIGHNAVVHGARLENGCLVGMNATVLSGAVVGEGALVAAGALVPQGVVVPPHTLFAGIPGRVIRELRPEERESVRLNAENYLGYMEHHRLATRG